MHKQVCTCGLEKEVGSMCPDDTIDSILGVVLHRLLLCIPPSQSCYRSTIKPPKSSLFGHLPIPPFSSLCSIFGFQNRDYIVVHTSLKALVSFESRYNWINVAFGSASNLFAGIENSLAIVASPVPSQWSRSLTVLLIGECMRTILSEWFLERAESLGLKYPPVLGSPVIGMGLRTRDRWCRDWLLPTIWARCVTGMTL